jgi:sarcosine oxidase subunit beta
MTVKSADVIVIGAGVIGCSIAYELARDELSVCVVERGTGPGQRSTSASWESKHLWEQWEDHLDGTDGGFLARFYKTGGLCLESPGNVRCSRSSTVLESRMTNGTLRRYANDCPRSIQVVTSPAVAH